MIREIPVPVGWMESLWVGFRPITMLSDDLFRRGDGAHCRAGCALTPCVTTPSSRRGDLASSIEATVKSSQPAVLEAFLCQGADPNSLVDRHGNGALHAAVQLAPPVCLRAFIAAGANVHLANRWGSTALHFAAELGNDESVRVLLDAGADPRFGDSNGVTPLHDAAAHDALPVASLRRLIQGGAVDPVAADGRTPLMHAVQSCAQASFTVLLDKGANPCITAVDGSNVVSAAAALRCSHSRDFLRQMARLDARIP